MGQHVPRELAAPRRYLSRQSVIHAGRQSLVLALIRYALLLLPGIVMLAPFVWMVLSSLKSFMESSSYPPILFPSRLRFENYAIVFGKLHFFRYFLNTCLVSISVCAGQLVIGLLAGYGFAKLRFPGRSVLFFVYLGTMMIPVYVVLIPSFILMKQLGWIDTFLALIIPPIFESGLVFGIFLMRQFYLTVPDELLDSATIDGSSPLRTYAQVVMPLSSSVLLAFGILSFVWAWNSLLWPLIVTNGEAKRVLAIALALFQGMFDADYHLAMAAATVSQIPLITAYVIGQKYVLQGITLSGFGGR